MGEQWSSWINLPCADSPSAISAACPDGWAELLIEQGMTVGTPNEPPEGYRSVCVVRLWGFPGDGVADLDAMLEGVEADSALGRVRAGMFVVLARVIFDDGDPEVDLLPHYYFDLTWGTEDSVVYQLPPAPRREPGEVIEGESPPPFCVRCNAAPAHTCSSCGLLLCEGCGHEHSVPDCPPQMADYQAMLATSMTNPEAT